MEASLVYQGPRMALTGGIGSGKSFVAQLLQARGIEVFDCDAVAKHLLRTNKPLMQSLRQLVGDHLYAEGCFQTRVLAAFILASEDNKQRVNELVHPAVAQAFEQSSCLWLESAIFFDSGFDRRVHVDKVVCVTAPLEVRIQRVMQRDRITRERTVEWIDRQLSQEEVLQRSDYEIVNDGTRNIDEQTNELLTKLIKL